MSSKYGLWQKAGFAMEKEKIKIEENLVEGIEWICPFCEKRHYRQEGRPLTGIYHCSYCGRDIKEKKISH